MADLQVSIALLLENQDEIRRALEAEGGRAGQAFRNRLSPEAQKAFAEITSAAEKAAKDVGVKFNSTKLQFETVKGDLIPSSTLDKLGQVSKKFEEARRAADVFKGAVVTSSKDAASSLNLLEAAVQGVAVSLTSRLTDAAMSGIGALKNMVGGFMELDGELRSAAAAAGEADGYERLGAVVEKVGIDAAGTSKQVAELATSLVKAGFNVSEVETALPGVVRGAEATGTAFERFGEITGATLRQFGLEASEIGRVSDVVTQTVNQTNATTEGFAYAMNEAAPVAKALGVTLEDTAAAIGILANAGLQGSVAGTGFKTMLLKMQQAAGGASPEVLGLAQGQERLAKVMKMMGGEILDASGKMIPLDQALLKIKATMDTLSQGDRTALATTLFGEDGGPKFLAIINQSGDAIQGVFGKVRNSAGAVDAAREATNGFGRQLTTLTGTLDSLAIGVGRVAADGLTPLLSAANFTIGVLAGLPGPIKDGAAAMGILTTSAVAAGVALAGLNAAVGMVGGWVALAGSVRTVIALLSSPFAGTVGTFLALASAAGLVASQFGGMSSGLKSLTQGAGALGAFLITLRLLKGAQEAWTTATKATATWQAFLTALGGPRGIAQIVIAAGAAGLAYAGLGAAIKETGQETAELEGKAKTLKDKLASLDEQINQGKKLNLDTSDLEKIRAETIAELKTVENPLEIKLNAEQAEAKVKSLKEQLDKLDKGDSKAPVLKAQLEAAEKMKEIMKAAEQGVGSSAYQKLDAQAKEFLQTQAKIQSEMDALRAQQIKLDPELDKEKWAKIEQQMAAKASELSNNKVKFTAELDASRLAAQRAKLEADLAKVKAPLVRADLSQGYGESDAAFAKRQAEQKEKEREITEQIYAIIIKQAEAQGAVTRATEGQVTAADRAKKAEDDRAAALQKSLQASSDQLDLADKLMEADKKRLGAVKDLADTYMELAKAQEDLVKSQFDVDLAVNEGQTSKIKDEMDAIKDASKESIDKIREEIQDLDKVIERHRDMKIDTSGLEAQKRALQDNIDQQERDTKDTLKPKEEQIKALKEESKKIEEQALIAAIEGAQKRFEMERKILQLKQMAEEIEARSAVRASEKAALQAQIELSKLEQKRNDPTATPEDKAKIDDQIQKQRQIIGLIDAQVAADKEVLAGKKEIFAMQEDTLGLQQAAGANKLFGEVAKKFPDSEAARNAARKLQNSVPDNGYQSTMKWDDIAKKADNVLGVIRANNKALQDGEKDVAKLAEAWKKMPGGNGKQGGMSKQEQQLQEERRLNKAMQDPNFYKTEEGKRMMDEYNQYAEKARNKELEQTRKWKKEMEAAGFVELKVEGMPQNVSDGIVRETLTGQKQPQVDAWFASPEGRAAVEKWRSSTQGATDDLQNFDDMAKRAGMSTAEFENQLERAGFVELDTKNLEVDQQTAESLQKMRDELFGPEAQKKLFVTPQVDTTQASQDLQAFKDQQSQDPFSLDFASTGLDQVQADFANAANSIVPFLNQVNQLGVDLQNLGGESVDPFVGAGQSLAEAAYGVQGLVQGLETAQQTAVDFDATLAESANADQIQQAYDALKPPDVSQAVSEQGNLAQGTEGTVSTTQDLANSWIGVASSINTAAQALSNYKSQEGGSQARFAGGDVFGGRQYTVNELGQESFLSSTGRLSLIRAPQYGHWTAPSRGLVIPASMTSRLEAAGAFSRGGGPGPRVSAALMRPSTGAGREVAALSRLQRSIDRLEKTMGSYRPPDVSVSIPGNAGLLHTLQSIR